MRISAEMRDMIDRAMASGKVTYLPPVLPKVRGEKSSVERLRVRSSDVTVAATVHRLPGADLGPPVEAAPAPAATGAGDVSDLSTMSYADLIELRARVAALIEAKRTGYQSRGEDRLNRKLLQRAAKKIAVIRDQRRIVFGTPAGGEFNRVIPGLTGTQFPDSVRDPVAGEVVLKGGENEVKLGAVVLVGALRGARIVSLALEERKTCPRSCPLWDPCMTNSMPRLIRYRHGPMLEAKIRDEVAILCADHERVLVRLHLSGDFYGIDYLKVWADLLDAHPGLHVFGFTAWPDDSPIGREIARLREADPQRFAVRTSGRAGRWGSFVVPALIEAPMIGDAVVCPEQRDANAGFPKRKHCGSCAFCWSSDRPLAFMGH